MKAYLILENGSVFEGVSFGGQEEIISEFVFNTSMSGYLEIITDPSYEGQSVVMTYPLIGNYGVCLDDVESSQPHVKAFVVNDVSRVASHFRMNMSLEDYCVKNKIVGIKGVDTRHLTKMIRDYGCMNGMVTTQKYENICEVVERIKAFRIKDAVEQVTCQESYTLGEGKVKVAVYDFGIKTNILNELVNRGCEVTVYPAKTPADTIIKGGFDGVMLSNGPGDPRECTDIIYQIRKLIDSKLPIFGICLGHQLIALAHDLEITKLKYGHHGANHPVKDLKTNRVYISTQNHNYVVKNNIDEDIAKVWFINVNDTTIEGLEYCNEKVRTVQFHPEACAGPLDTGYLFDEFIEMIGGKKNA